MEAPDHLDINKEKGLTVRWSDGSESFFTVTHLRKMSPSADMRHLREEMKKNPLTVLPSSFARSTGPLAIRSAELVGNYALKIEFSDGHSSGIFTWEYLHQIDTGPASSGGAQGPSAGSTPA